MKKLILSLILIFFVAIPVMARVTLDGYGLYNDTGDAKTQYGGGAALGIGIAGDFGFIIRSMFSSVTENRNRPDKKRYTHFIGSAGVEYIYPINKYRLGWRNSVSMGFSVTKENFKEYDTASSEYKDKEYYDKGLSVGLTTGIQYNFTQFLSGFLDIGYHYSFYDGDLEKENIRGFQAMVGVRFSFSDVKQIGENY